MRNLFSVFLLLVSSISFADIIQLQPGNSIQVGDDTIMCLAGGNTLMRECRCTNDGCGTFSTARLVLMSEYFDATGRTVRQSCSVMQSETACQQAMQNCR